MNEEIVSATISAEQKEYLPFPSATRDLDESSVISLSTIVNTLQDVNSETPRRLVDELLMAQKKKNQPVIQNKDTRKDTYTLNSDRKSMLVTSSGNLNKSDNNISTDLATKLSLDSKIKSKTTDEITDLKQEYLTLSSFNSTANIKDTESFMNLCKEKVLKEETSDRNVSLFNQDAGT